MCLLLGGSSVCSDTSDNGRRSQVLTNRGYTSGREEEEAGRRRSEEKGNREAGRRKRMRMRKATFAESMGDVEKVKQSRMPNRWEVLNM